jgi:hypothetical protein
MRSPGSPMRGPLPNHDGPDVGRVLFERRLP